MTRVGLALALALAPGCIAPALAAPIADGQEKFLGSAYAPAQAPGFDDYWNKVTPENAGKWGRVEAVRDRMEWSGLDAAYQFARSRGFKFHMHVMVWGNQQPAWIENLPVAEQRAEIEEWFAAVAARYPDIDFVEVVNEPLHDPPNRRGEGGGNYLQALGGDGATGWDWVVASYTLARAHFPRARLMINEYSITNNAADAQRYRQIIDLLKARGLVDIIGVQGHAFSTGPGVSTATTRANLDLLAATGLPIHVTELDIDGATDAIQLADYQRIFPLFWRHPAVHGITLWGYRPGLWRDAQRAYLVNPDGSERPALAWLRQYVRNDLPPPDEAPPPRVVAPGTTIGRIERFHADLDLVVSPDAVIEPLAEGFTWSEGPAWIPGGNYLLFTDVPENTLYRWSRAAGLSVFARPSGYAGPPNPALREPGANGLLYAGGNILLLADSGNRTVVQMDLQSGQRLTLASSFRGRRLNSPNDLARHSNGSIYFTDPPYGLTGVDASPARELGYSGVFRRGAEGRLALLSRELRFPNGVALAPDQRTLYVSNSDPARPVWWAFALDADGRSTGHREFADASDLVGDDAPGLPDGMAVAASGHLYASAPGGVLVFAPDGRRLGRIVTGSAVSNCELGEDGRVLYVTSHHRLARVRLAGGAADAVP